MNYITSPANPRIKALSQLSKPRERRGKGRILIEGFREIELAVRYGWDLLEVYYCPDLYQGPLPKAPESFNISREALDKIAYKENPEGLLAVATSKTITLADLKLPKKPLIIILENVEKPGNLGAILRTAYAAGVSAVIINDQQTDLYNPNVIRASMGHIFSVSTVVANFEETRNWLTEQKIKILATTIDAAIPYTTADLTKSVAIVLGTENSGLSHHWRSAADQNIIIPMREGIDSLNVSVSAAIITYEALRQRS